MSSAIGMSQLATPAPPPTTVETATNSDTLQTSQSQEDTYHDQDEERQGLDDNSRREGGNSRDEDEDEEETLVKEGEEDEDEDEDEGDEEDEEEDEEEEDDASGGKSTSVSNKGTNSSTSHNNNNNNTNSRRNKRKNFKPRNIVTLNEEEGAGESVEEGGQCEQSQANNEDNEEEGPLNLSGDSSSLMANNNHRKSLLPPRRRLDMDKESSNAMDLSVEQQMQQQSSNSLSVVRPEILFGQQPQADNANNQQHNSQQMSLLPFLAAMSASAFNNPSSTAFMDKDKAGAMKETFQEVLKLYGVPTELAESIAKNAQSAQGLLQQQQQNVRSSPPPPPPPPSLLPPPPTTSSAMNNNNETLMKSNNSSLAFPNFPQGMLLATPPSTHSPSSSSHPPTPPRTPKTPTDLSFMSRLQQLSEGAKLPTSSLATPITTTSTTTTTLSSSSSSSSSTTAAITSGDNTEPTFNYKDIKEKVAASKAPNPSVLAAQQLSKSPLMMPGLIPGLPIPPQMGTGGGPLPPHILAAQRAGMLPGGPKTATDYTRYFKRFSSSLECGSFYCKDMNYREHFHCTVPMCKDKLPFPKVFAKKEEMIRHSKWHQKMDEAFKYGFRRVTPMDDCSDQFPECPHNKKQTHYHCIHTAGCDKVYISTSDVQMHFNYHRKDNAIQREGFLRFRGTEDCATPYCPYRHQKTTHFHCNRSECQFIFKNKADMEKHKNFHMKDEQLNKDGFKKFMKNDNCGFENCRFSESVNHIHCIRSNCDYVLHSSGQLYAHKRKHERKDHEAAYKKYKMAQGLLNANGDLDRPPSNDGSLASDASSTPPLFKTEPGTSPFGNLMQTPSSTATSVALKSPFGLPIPVMTSLPGSGGLYGSHHGGGHFGLTGPAAYALSMNSEDVWRNYLLHFDAGEGCGFQGCEIEEVEHYHCKDEGCESVFRSEDGVKEHGKNHFIQDQITEVFFVKSDPEDFLDDDEESRGPKIEDPCPEDCPHKRKVLHYHCKWENCTEIICNTDSPFKRLDHYKLHEYTRKWNMNNNSNTGGTNSRPPTTSEQISMTMATSIDAMFKRKRGRPPKNRVVEVWNDQIPPMTSNGGMIGSMSGLAGGPDFTGSPQAVFTSFKLPKPGLVAPSPAIMASMANSTLPLSSFLPKSTVSSETSHASASTSSGPVKMTAPLGGLPDMSVKGTDSKPSNSSHDDPSEPKTDSDQADSDEAKSRAARRDKSDEEQSDDSNTPPRNQGLIKAKGTYYPLTAFPTNMPQGPVMRRDDASPPRTEQSSGDETSPTISLKSKLGINFLISCVRQGDDNALAKLLQVSQEMNAAEINKLNKEIEKSDEVEEETKVALTNKLAAAAAVAAAAAAQQQQHQQPPQPPPLPTQPPLFGPGPMGVGFPSMPGIPSLHMDRRRRGSVSSHPVFGPEPQEESCGRPFCKLKRRAHYHCNFCNQGFTEKEKLEPHLKRHVAGLPPSEQQTHQQQPQPMNLETLLREGMQRDPTGMSLAHADLMMRSQHKSGGSVEASPASSPSLISSKPQDTPLSLVSSPSSNKAPPAESPPSSSPAATSTPPSPFLSHSVSSLVNSPFASLVRSPFPVVSSTSAAQPPLIPPGMHPFFPPGMLLPGLPNPFQRPPAAPSFDPTNHPLTRMPDPSAGTGSGATKRGNSPMSLFDSETGAPEKKMRMQSGVRMLKDEPVPEGYMRFRFNEDCGFSNCNYREHQTHFHCMRKDCNYRFCDKTRFVQHTARHERLDTLCGTEFQGFRGVECGRENCELNISNNRPPLPGEPAKSSSHFHCLKCDYYCTDTNKKLDSILAAGFEKHSPGQSCTVSGCGHSGKQTHYHCKKCQYAVLGLSQMEAHKYRHMNE